MTKETRKQTRPEHRPLRRSLALAETLMNRGYLAQAADVMESFYREASELEWEDGPELQKILAEARSLAGEIRGRISEVSMSGYSLGARAEPPVEKIEANLDKVRDLMKRGYAASALQLLDTIHQALWYWEDTGHPEIQRLLDEARSLAGRLRAQTGSGSGMGEYYLGEPAMALYLSKEDMANLLVTAWEGGSNYWVDYADYVPPKGMTLKELKKVAWENLPEKEKEFWKESEGVPLYSMLPYLPPKVKWKIKFKPQEDDEEVYLTPENMREAVVKLAEKYPHIFANIKSENYDAGDADAWLQMALFDDVIFG